MTVTRESGATVTRWICSACGSRYASPEDCPLCHSPVHSLYGADKGEDPLVGTTLGDRYRILARIGKGSVGTIFRAIDNVTQKQVAIKVLRRHLISDKDLRRRFEQEGQAIKRLQHKNLIAMRDFGTNPEPYFVMEYLDGQSLAEMLGELTYIPAERLIPIMMQVCAAMLHAHEQGVLHRDIKPANIMLVDLPRERDLVKVLDFGLAKLIDQVEASLTLATKPGDVLGTPLYMSPEQSRGAKLDSRSDIYSLGCVMYECLTGLPPISGSGIVEILRNQVSYVPPPMREVRPYLHIPEKLESIVEKSMRKDPNERYNSMLELADDLRAANAQVMAATATTVARPAADKSAGAGNIWGKLLGMLRKSKPDEQV